MKKFILGLLLFVFSAQQIVRADEGMWLPFLIGRNYEDMKKHGLKLTKEQLYSINNASLKDAVISFGGFCTGELISGNSLVLTNHHCGYDAIAAASTPEKNYLDNGFWAKNNGEEIPVPGLTATFMIRMEDVSATVLKELNNSMTNEQRAAKVKEVTDILVKDATRGTNYEAFVSDFYNGNEFYLFVKETFKDVRLVGTPPQSAGKYGGDTDNWMWPRHTADFSMFRIYSGKDNKPAAYSTENVPFKPRNFLPISLKGVQQNDFAMIMGFPGRTNRYLTSYGVEQAVKYEQPKIVEIRKMKLDLMKKYMDKDVATRLNYSSKYAQVANYWKYFDLQSQQLVKNKVADKKRVIEGEFTKYIANKPEYANVLKEIEAAFTATNSIINIKTYQSEFVRQVDLNSLVFIWKKVADSEIKAQDTKGMRDGAAAQAEILFSERKMETEIEILTEVLKMYIRDVPFEQRKGMTRALVDSKSITQFIRRVEKKSIFVDKGRYENFVKNYSLKTLERDPLFILIKDLDDAYNAAMSNPAVKKANDDLVRNNRLFVQVVREMNPTKLFAPNANSTMRLTYGNVLRYSNQEGVDMGFTTDIEGLMKKEKPGDPEFTVDARMKEVYSKKDFGQYIDKKAGTLIVNFLTNNDITGGNSGSPCINGNGELIGTAFDGNSEAMSGDIYFEPNLQRTIVCDIRYVLWLVDKCYGATNLINEMKLVK